MYDDRSALDFAYRYPFSKDARDIIAHAPQELDERLVRAGKLRVEEDLLGSAGYHPTGMADIKRTHVLSYVYSRMLISAVNSAPHTEKYARAEARRAGSSLEADTLPNVLKLQGELGLEMGYAHERFVIGFSRFLAASPKSGRLALARQELEKGAVYLDRTGAVMLIEGAVAAEIRKNLPIPASELPARILEEAKTLSLPKIAARADVKGSYGWIERMLSNPIADVRHRTVNLVLAPYLVNVRGMPVDDAAKVITDYIERCKQMNPDTRINSTYIKYQCKYAKEKGMRPLSLEKARELYRGVLDLG